MEKEFNLTTPCYCIDYEELEYNYNSMNAAFLKHWGENYSLGYSVKTNNIPWILEYMLEKGSYAEVVSLAEYQMSRKIGFKLDEIIYNGPYKDYNTLRHILNNKVIVNVDSTNTLKKIIDMKLKDINILIRLNFDFESECPEEVELDGWPSRFGISLEDGSFKEAIDVCKKAGIKVVGLHVHQSLKKRSIKAFKVISRTIAETILKYDLKDEIKYIDVGGGFFGGRGVEGKPTFDEYAKVITEELNLAVDRDKVKLLTEPGSSLVSSPISYYMRVESVKDIRGYRILVVDGSNLHTNPFEIKRTPAYVVHYSHSAQKIYKGAQLVTGSTCLENDRFFEVVDGMELHVGDIIEIKTCGGYTVSLNSCFINMPPNVYLKKDREYKKVREQWNIDVLF